MLEKGKGKQKQKGKINDFLDKALMKFCQGRKI